MTPSGSDPAQSEAAARTARLVAAKWTLLIIGHLARGPLRFHELQRNLPGISPKTLSDRLHQLDSLGIVSRHVYAEVPPRVEYSLTEKGRALLPLVNSLEQYGQQWLPPDDSPMP
ncbi:MAG: helix-turn-helix domain-containing protein [Bacillota bacterium]|nr:helix-turn-helix domain-containing protein [Bacillota bacterium]MDI7249785.1 helix-turn-helix domain-containing protein [Bacillota bacterium]